MQVTKTVSSFDEFKTCQTLLETFHKEIMSTFDPVPSMEKFDRMIFRIAILASAILVYPILMIGVALEKGYNFVVQLKSEPLLISDSPLAQGLNGDLLMEQLPLETQNIIFSQYLGVKDLIALSRTCKHLRTKIFSDALANYINTTKTPILSLGFSPTHTDQLLQLIGKKLTCLNLEPIAFKIETRITRKTAHRWVSFCPNLTHLRLANLSPLTVEERAGFNRFDWFCPLVKKGILKTEKLEFLCLTGCGIRAKEAKEIATFKKLTHLNLNGNTIGIESIYALTQPEPEGNQNLINENDINNQEIPPTQLTNLLHLHLSKNKLDATSIRNLATRLKVFQKLESFGCGKNIEADSNSILSLIIGLKELPNLSRLLLSFSNTDNTGAQAIAQNLPNLASLDLSCNRNRNLDIRGVLNIVQSLKGLLELNLSFLFGIRNIEDLSQIVDELVTHDELSTFTAYFPGRTKEEQQTIKMLKTRLLEKFPKCNVAFDGISRGGEGVV